MPDLPDPLVSGRIMALRDKVLRGQMVEVKKLTAQSIAFRQKAAAISREASEKTDLEKELLLLQRACCWIQVAENEELLAEHQLTERQ